MRNFAAGRGKARATPYFTTASTAAGTEKYRRNRVYPTPSAVPSSAANRMRSGRTCPFTVFTAQYSSAASAQKLSMMRRSSQTTIKTHFRALPARELPPL